MTTYGSCCYAECPNSYSTDSDAVFFKFPLEPARRKKWIENCGNPELPQLADRQLRGKRVCARHFLPISFVNPTIKEVLTDKAIPVVYSASTESSKPKPVSGDTDTPVQLPDTEVVKRGRGRPAADSSKSKPTSGDIETPTQTAETEVVKRGRGRPADPSKSKPTPGASGDVETPTSSAAAQTPDTAIIKRGRGRPADPSKSKLISGDIETPTQTSDTEITVRGKGRPSESLKPKISGDTEESEPPTQAPDAEVVKRGRGRQSESAKPKLSEDVEGVTPIQTPDVEGDVVKRGRGRPRTKHLSVAIKVEPEDSDEEPPSKKPKPPVTPSATPGKSLAAHSTRSTSAGVELKVSLRKLKKAESEEDATDGDKDWPEPTTKDRTLVGSVKKEAKTIEKFLVELRSQCTLSDQWTLSGILWDPGHKMKMIAASEMDVTTTGSMRLKRCVQIYEDMSVKILVDEMDMTPHFELPKINGPSDIAKIVTITAMAKLCPGIKSFDSMDATYFPMAVKRGGSWFSPDCPVIVDNGLQGPLCPTCARLRSSVRRRKIKEKMEMEKKQARVTVKVQTTFGKALYSLLTDLMTEDTTGVKKPFVRQIGSGSAENDGDHASKEGVELSKGDGKNGFPSITPKGGISSSMAKRIRPKSAIIGHDELSKSKPRAPPRGGRRPGANATDGQNEGVVEMLEQYVTIEGENGNLILQPSSGEFTLAEGQEYELIGEADANEPMQVVDPENPHQTIEIIEVDDHTMAQLQLGGHGVNDMFFQGSENIQVTEIDPNDPNMGQLLKVIDPSQGFSFQ